MTALAPIALIVFAVALAAVANRRLGWRIETDPPPSSETEERWLEELAVLELERRHPIC